MSKKLYDREKAQEILDEAKKVTASCEFLFKKTSDDPVRISWESIVALPIGIRIYVGPGIWMTRIDSAFLKGIVFFVEMADGAAFELHDHDCFEWFKVITGAILGVDEEVYYDPKELHNPTAVGQTMLLVRIKQTPFIR